MRFLTRILTSRALKVALGLYKTWGRDSTWVSLKRLAGKYFSVVIVSRLLIIVIWWLQQCVSLVLSLISSSMDAWRTRQYDYYQRVLNGILWCSLQEWWTYSESNFHVSIGKPWDCTGHLEADLDWHPILIPRVNKVLSTVVPCGISYSQGTMLDRAVPAYCTWMWFPLLTVEKCIVIGNYLVSASY
jgi:hypothetical protein